MSKGDKFSIKQRPNNEIVPKFMKDIPYASTLRSLMYAQVCTHPNLVFIMGTFGRYQSDPGREHWVSAKRAFKYLQKTKGYTLIYRKSKKLKIIGYSNFDFERCQDSRKSTSGYYILRLPNFEIPSL